MPTSTLYSLGWNLGSAYELYALFVLVFGSLAHPLVLLGFAWAAPRQRAQWLVLTVEVVYGLLNPLVYLLVLQPALFRTVSPAWLTALSWVLLVAYWFVLLVTSVYPEEAMRWRRAVRGLLLCCMLLVAGVGIRDLWFTLFLASFDINEPFHSLLPLIVSPLYLLPVLIAGHRWRLARSESTRAQRSALAGSRSARALMAGVVLAAFGTVLLALWRPPEASTRATLLEHRQAILDVSARARIDPRLLASILFVTHREHTTPFRSAVEEVAVGAWVKDLTSHTLLAGALDPSLGLAQVKPVTVLTALTIQHASAGGTWIPSKEYREVPASGDAWKRIPTPALAHIVAPLTMTQSGNPPGKREVVQALLTPERNLALAAYVLDLTAAQWETANPAWSIRQRPEVLATLYQLGFQHSYPKPDPQPNAFGQRVAELMEEPWMRGHFGSGAAN